MQEDLALNKDALSTRITKGGIFVCRLHYAADQFKNPQNPVGRDWLKQALSGYPGGIEDPNWLKEMEIMYSAGSGERVLPRWQEWQKSSNIFISGELDVKHSKIYASYDHGWATPACYLVHAVDPDGMRKTIWEFYGAGVPVSDIAKIIKGQDVRLEDGRQFEGNPYAGLESVKVCDPEITRRTQVMPKGPNKSIAELYLKQNIIFQPGTRGDDGTVINWLLGNLWSDPMQPQYQIHRRCKNLIWEMGRLQRKALSPMQARVKNQPEELVDKDNHAFDALKYFLKRFPVGAPVQVKPKKEADFAFWRDMSKRRTKLSYVREFAR
jgi:hypothetical protein